MLSALVTIDRSRLAGAAGPVVRKEEFSRLIEAQQLVSQAQRHSDALRAAIASEVEAARRAGYEAGTRAAQADFAASMVETVAQMQAAFLRLEMRIVNTVMSAIEQILRQVDDRFVLESLVRQALAGARAQKQLRLRVAAAQFDGVNEWLSTLLKEFPEVEFIDVLKDPTAARGTCVLESELGCVDASLDVQLEAVRRGLVNAFIDKRVAAATVQD